MMPCIGAATEEPRHSLDSSLSLRPSPIEPPASTSFLELAEDWWRQVDCRLFCYYGPRIPNECYLHYKKRDERFWERVVRTSSVLDPSSALSPFTRPSLHCPLKLPSMHRFFAGRGSILRRFGFRSGSKALSVHLRSCCSGHELEPRPRSTDVQRLQKWKSFRWNQPSCRAHGTLRRAVKVPPNYMALHIGLWMVPSHIAR